MHKGDKDINITSREIIVNSKRRKKPQILCSVLWLIYYIVGHGFSQVPYQIRIPNPITTLYYAKHVHIAWTFIQIPIQTQIPNCYCTHFWDRYPYPVPDLNPCSPM